MKKRKLLWKVPLALTGVLLGVVLLLLIAVAAALYVTPIRNIVLDKGIAIAREQTGMDIDLQRLYLSPFHHSPRLLYLAYKGKADLPVRVEIDSLFIGHRGQDTLVYVHALRLNATALTNHRSPITDVKSIPPIVVDRLQLDQTTFHSDSLIKTVGVDVVVGNLTVSSPQIEIAEGKYPLHGLRISDADVGIDLRPDTLPKDTTPLLLAFDVPDGELRNVRFRLTPLGLGIKTNHLATNALVDVGSNVYEARQLNVGGFAFSLGDLCIPADTIYGNALTDLSNNHITSNGLHVRSNELGAKADLYTTTMNLET
ncbi:MAG: hypothetical protein J6T32_00215, partial [Paludibacteraceae bacterium]|nr:hypothetical protein [Paludibacteraceae bacterium]